MNAAREAFGLTLDHGACEAVRGRRVSHMAPLLYRIVEAVALMYPVCARDEFIITFAWNGAEVSESTFRRDISRARAGLAAVGLDLRRRRGSQGGGGYRLAPKRRRVRL